MTTRSDECVNCCPQCYRHGRDDMREQLLEKLKFELDCLGGHASEFEQAKAILNHLINHFERRS